MTVTQSAVKEEPQPVVQAAPLFLLLYRSHSLCRSDADVAQILHQARTNNAALEITGALMLYEDWFSQVLEGPEQAVKAVFERIKADPRHNSVEVIDSKAVDHRAFEHWKMAYVGEHGEADIPMMAIGDHLEQSAPWRPRSNQEAMLAQLRQVTRGYGRGS